MDQGVQKKSLLMIKVENADELVNQIPKKLEIKELEVNFIGQPNFTQQWVNKYFCEKSNTWYFIDVNGNVYTFNIESKATFTYSLNPIYQALFSKD